jgi:uncharacterized membrane protein YbaN (DUF454 family)
MRDERMGGGSAAGDERRHEDVPVLGPVARRRWQRAVWMGAGGAALATGVVGIFLPLLPTTPLVILAAFCFSRGCLRCERWLLGHPRFGPMVRDWRRHHVIPLRAKQIATAMMAGSSLWAWFAMPVSIRWLPAVACAAVAWWMWRQPSRARAAGRAAAGASADGER